MSQLAPGYSFGGDLGLMNASLQNASLQTASLQNAGLQHTSLQNASFQHEHLLSAARQRPQSGVGQLHSELSLLHSNPSFGDASSRVAFSQPLAFQDVKAEPQADLSGDGSPAGSTTFVEGDRAMKQGSGGSGDKSMPVLDKKALAKQRYREKNRRAQARHRERNKKTIEDLTARVATLTAENQDLKLENAILSKIGEVKDEHLSKLRHSKENMSYLEAESLIAESYALSYPNTPITPEIIRSWCMEDSAKVRQDTIQKEANFLVAGGLNDITSPSFQSMQQEMTRKRRLSLRFAVGKPRFVQSLYSWEREYAAKQPQPDFKELWRNALAVMRLTSEQRMQMVTARALLLSKMRTILIERHSLIAAAKAGAMEGVADVLVSSLEEERQVVFGFLFTFFDETLTLLQECSCDVELFPWGPDVLAMSDILMEEAVAESSSGLEGLGLDSHLVPTRKDGSPDLDVLMRPGAQQLASLMAGAQQAAAVANAAGVAWPSETPFQRLSIPITTCGCGTSGISLLRNMLMFPSGVMPMELPVGVPRELILKTPILSMIKKK